MKGAEFKQMADDFYEKNKNWLIDEYGNDPVIRKGQYPGEQCTQIEATAITHLYSVLLKYYIKRLYKKGGIQLFIANDSKPVVKVLLSKRLKDFGATIISIGMIRAVAALSARMSQQFDDKNIFLYFLNPDIRNKNFQKLYDKIELKEFLISEYKNEHCGFSTKELKELSLKLDNNKSYIFIEILCASLEFLVLHEWGHIANRHIEAIQYYRFESNLVNTFKKAFSNDSNSFKKIPEIRISRCFEHQADYFALYNMYKVAPPRPYLSNLRFSDNSTSFLYRRDRKLLAFLAASISFALVSLLSAEESTTDNIIIASDSPMGTHPTPSIRLNMCTLMLINNISLFKKIFLILGGSSFKSYSKFLQQVGFLSTMTSSIILKKNWSELFSSGIKGDEKWSLKILKQQKEDLDMLLGETHKTDMELANRIVEAAIKLKRTNYHQHLEYD